MVFRLFMFVFKTDIFSLIDLKAFKKETEERVFKQARRRNIGT